MTAASQSRRDRRHRRQGMLVFEKPPMLCGLRPMTVADLEPGDTWIPGLTVLEIRHVEEDGEPKDPENIILRLKPELRENTTANLKEVIGRIRSVSDEVRELIDQYAIIHRGTPSINTGEAGRPLT